MHMTTFINYRYLTVVVVVEKFLHTRVIYCSYLCNMHHYVYALCLHRMQ